MAGGGNSWIVMGYPCRMTDSWFFNGSFGLYLVHKSWNFASLPSIPIVQNYLSDVLALPVLLSLTLDVTNWIKKGEHQLSFLHILFAVLYVSIFMECFAPMWSVYAVADWYDCLAYAVGGLIFYAAQRQIKAKQWCRHQRKVETTGSH